jgi:hypothetical protein
MNQKINFNLHTHGEKNNKSKKGVTLYKQCRLGNFALKRHSVWLAKEEEFGLQNYLKTWLFKMDQPQRTLKRF